MLYQVHSHPLNLHLPFELLVHLDPAGHVWAQGHNDPRGQFLSCLCMRQDSKVAENELTSIMTLFFTEYSESQVPSSHILVGSFGRTLQQVFTYCSAVDQI